MTGWRWWKLAIGAGVALALVVLSEGGPKAVLALHFSGYLWLLEQFGKPVLHALSQALPLMHHRPVRR